MWAKYSEQHAFKFSDSGEVGRDPWARRIRIREDINLVGPLKCRKFMN